MFRSVIFWILSLLLIAWSGYWVFAVIAVSWMSEDIAMALIKGMPIFGETYTPQSLSENFRILAAIAGAFLWSMPAAALASCAVLVRPSRSKEPAMTKKKTVAAAPATRQEPTL